MMQLSEALQLFQDNVGRATVRSPDNYPEWDPLGYPAHRTELLGAWSSIRAQVRSDASSVVLIDEKLAEAIASFDRGERQPGQRLMFEIYNVLNQGKLR